MTPNSWQFPLTPIIVIKTVVGSPPAATSTTIGYTPTAVGCVPIAGETHPRPVNLIHCELISKSSACSYRSGVTCQGTRGMHVMCCSQSLDAFLVGDPVHAACDSNLSCAHGVRPVTIFSPTHGRLALLWHPPLFYFSPTGVECHSPARRNPACVLPSFVVLFCVLPTIPTKLEWGQQCSLPLANSDQQ